MLILLAFVSVFAAIYRFVRVQASLRTLYQLGSPPPQRIVKVFAAAQRGEALKLLLLYVDVKSRFCFTTFDGPRVVISRGFEDGLSDDALRLVAEHEIAHIRSRDPWRSLGWHLTFAAFILPGFSALEQLLYQLREVRVDNIVASADRQTYAELLAQCSTRSDRQFGTICTASLADGPGLRVRSNASPEYLRNRTLPAFASIGVLVLVLLSHEVFSASLPYLQTHHC
ncbi:MAG: hypothetical protein M3Y21_03650 [Candidatus Eremiobacteraeota bacterium]|nr:hypothetical protein [Candidatus Eremiobacteraeota bacterium]